MILAGPPATAPISSTAVTPTNCRSISRLGTRSIPYRRAPMPAPLPRWRSMAFPDPQLFRLTVASGQKGWLWGTHATSLCGTERPSRALTLPLSLRVIVMIIKISISLAFAAACLTAAVAMPAHAATSSARQNVIHSDHYTRMLQTNRAFRQARMRKECGPITDPQLHQQCLASFREYSPMVASATSHRRVASSGHHAKQYVGSSAGPQHYQSHLGK